MPEIIDNPALVLSSHSRSKENNTRLLTFGMVKDINGKPVMAVLDLQPFEKGLLISDMQKLTSAYSLTGEEVSFDDYLNKSEVLYVTENKNIATKLVRQIGFHQNGVPIGFQQSGYIGSISYSNQAVKIQGVPFSEIVKEYNELTGEHANADYIYTKNGDFVNLSEQKNIPKLDRSYSRNTRLNHDENFDDVNDAFEQAIKVLQNIKGIDVSSEVVEEVGNGRLLALIKKVNL